MDPTYISDPSEPSRQRSVERHGLAGDTAWAEEDGELKAVAVRAQQLFGADFCAINILDGDVQRSIAGTPGVPVNVSQRSASLCSRVLADQPQTRVFVTADASGDERFADSPWVTSQWAAVRFYASAFLLDEQGHALGTVCMWSDRVLEPTTDHVSQLIAVRDEVMGLLEGRRRHTESTVGQGRLAPTAGAPAGPSPRAVIGRQALTGAAPGAQWSIDALIDDRAVRTLFQPVVHLRSGQIAGFEALSRGPAGSDLETPEALLRAAKAAGRLGELDWLCRVHAMQAAADARLHPSVSWLINVEPAGLATECPPHLLPGLARARTELRVILEVVERDVEGYAIDLLHATDQARLDAWGVALDDVGAEEGSLALLPFLRPDVVKLDMSLVQNVPEPEGAVITAAVRAYAERTGAVILAEGIETEEHEKLAVVFGATYAQGYLYGAPGPLPAFVPPPRNVIPLRQQLPPLSGASPYDILSSHRESQRGDIKYLLHIARHLEDQSTHGGTASVLFIQLPETASCTLADQARYRTLAEANALTVVLGPGVPIHTQPRYQSMPIRRGGPRAGEHAVIVINPHFAAAFVSRDCGDPDTSRRRADFIYTHDRDTVIAAARGFLQELKPDPILPALSPTDAQRGPAETRTAFLPTSRRGLSRGR